MARAAENPFDDVEIPTLRAGLGYGLRAFGLVWKHDRWLTLAIGLLTVVLALLPAAAAWLAKLVIDSVLAAIESGAVTDRDTALIWVAAEAGVLASMLAVKRTLTFLKSMLQARLGYAVSHLIYDKTLRMDLSQLENATVQQQILLAKQYASARPYGLVNRIFETAQNAITLISFAIVLWTFSPLAVLVVIAGGLPLFISEVNFSGHMFRFHTGRTPEMRERSYLETLMTTETAAPERIHADSSPQILSRYESLFGWLFGHDRSLQARRAAWAVALGILSSAIFLGGKVWIVWVTIAGAITLGQMTMLVTVLRQGQNTLSTLLTAIGGGYEDLLYISNLYDLLAIDEAERTGSKTLGVTPGTGFQLSEVSFSYPGSTRPAIQGLTMDIPPGTQLGLVGANGSGKTTLVRLLMGLYTPTSGRITLDGTPLADWDWPTLAARTATLFQPFQRYKMTAGENISMGEGLRVQDPGLLQAAAEKGLAGPLIAELPEGLNTRLTKRFLDGRELSGGQWQRLALARAMLRSHADILILDEPTAALDPEAEGEFLELARREHRTLILISHRLSNLQHCDRIVMLDKGRIVETGTHDELFAAEGRYRKLFDQQGEFYREGGAS
ncbi:MAG: ABC transporter [Maricaulis sp.]|jgi:ABC-type multidrug transport system fused ATPase/permease subunit|nr:ABC transporter [Maricaulis sp.]|tara:strand:+ start:1580 stop:3421 length:1842 start_codon:yes stop_codon:yes gene_type:complete